jgi:hypothetical protein
MRGWMEHDDPARLAVVEELRRRAVEMYGEERAADGTLLVALDQAATAVWRVSRELLEPSDP